MRGLQQLIIDRFRFVLAAFLLYLRRFFEPMEELCAFYNSLQSALAALEKLSKTGWVDANREQVVANDYRKSMRIKAPNVGVLTGKLSGGNQQKVVLSKWMFTDPDVLILDEPTRGIDVGAKYEIYTIINQLAAQGKAIIVISSELPELMGICDRIYALSAGRITGEVQVDGANAEELMQYMTKEKE